MYNNISVEGNSVGGGGGEAGLYRIPKYTTLSQTYDVSFLSEDKTWLVAKIALIS